MTTEKERGRPRLGPRVMPIYDSLRACASATGIPIEFLKACKRHGFKAFRSNRIYLEDLLVELGPLLWKVFEGNSITKDVPDKAIEAALRERAERIKAEVEAEEALGNSVPMDEVQKMVGETLLPVRQRLMALASEACSRCNPGDPQLARAALDEWVASALPMIRSQLPGEQK